MGYGDDKVKSVTEGKKERNTKKKKCKTEIVVEISWLTLTEEENI